MTKKKGQAKLYNIKSDPKLNIQLKEAALVRETKSWTQLNG